MYLHVFGFLLAKIITVDGHILFLMKNSNKAGCLCTKLILLIVFRYVTSIYFVSTTASTVGYGDYYAKTMDEKIFMLFLEFIGICIFSIITGNMTNLRMKRSIYSVVKNKV
jgi:hypothetical protein